MLMKRLLLCLLIASLHALPARPQGGNTLFDDTRLCSVYITIDPDSLAVIYDSVLSDHYYLARFVFDDHIRKDTLENVGFRLRGNTSRYSQKKSFKISFSEYVPGRKYQGVKKINLNGEHNDPAMIREKLYYDLWKKAGMVERRTSFVKVYINGAYYGLYTNVEEMEKEWVSRVYTNNDGNLYKCTYPANLVYHGTDQQVYKDLQNYTVTGGRVYDLQTNKSEDDYKRLVKLITALNRVTGPGSAEEITAILKVDRYLKALALDIATGNWDDYSYNQNNYYLYDDPSDSTFDFITYDPDNIAGIDWFNIDWGTRDCRNWINLSIPLPMAQKLLKIPEFYDRYLLYLDTIATTLIHPDSLFPRIDALKQLIQQAAIEDTYRTLDYGYSIADFNNAYNYPIDDHTPYGLKPFFKVRRQAILDQLRPGGIQGGSESGVRLRPNPVTERMTLDIPVNQELPLVAVIFDSRGKAISRFIVDDRRKEITVGDLAPGVYILSLGENGQGGQIKFIKLPQ